MTANSTTQLVTLGSVIGLVRTTDQGDVQIPRSTIFDVMQAAEDAIEQYREKNPGAAVGEPTLTLRIHPVNDRYISYGWNAVGRTA